MLPGTILERARAIRLDKKALGAHAGISQKQTGLIMRGESSPRLDTFHKLESALIAEELRLRDYLLSIHPIETKREDAA